MTNRTKINAEDAALVARNSSNLFTYARELVIEEMLSIVVTSGSTDTATRETAYHTIKAADEIFARLDYLANCAQERQDNGN